MDHYETDPRNATFLTMCNEYLDMSLDSISSINDVVYEDKVGFPMISCHILFIVLSVCLPDPLPVIMSLPSISVPLPQISSYASV